MSKCLAKFEVIFWNSIFRWRGEAASLIYMEWPWLVPRRCRNAIWENFSQLYRVHDMLLWVFVGQLTNYKIFFGTWQRDLAKIAFKLISINFSKIPVKLLPCLKGLGAGSVVKDIFLNKINKGKDKDFQNTQYMSVNLIHFSLSKNILNQSFYRLKKVSLQKRGLKMLWWTPKEYHCISYAIF